MTNSAEMERDYYVALTGTFSKNRHEIVTALKDQGMEIFKSIKDYQRDAYADCLIIGDQPNTTKVIKADYLGLRLVGEAELDQLLGETPLEDIPTSYSPTGHAPKASVSADSRDLGPIALPESLRRIFSIIWDYNGRPKPEVSLGAVAAIEKKLGHQLPQTLIAYMLAANHKPKQALESITIRSTPSLPHYTGDVSEYVPEGFLRIPHSGAALPDGKGNEVGCEFLFLQGLESNVILRKVWDFDHEEDIEIRLEENFPVYEVNADNYDPARCPTPGSYECMAWLEYGDPGKLFIPAAEINKKDEGDDEEQKEFLDPLSTPLAQTLKNHGEVDIYHHFGKPGDYKHFYHYGKKALLDLTGPGFDEFKPTITKDTKKKQAFDVHHKKFGSGTIQAELGKDMVEVLFEDGVTRKLIRQYLEEL